MLWKYLYYFLMVSVRRSHAYAAVLILVVAAAGIYFSFLTQPSKEAIKIGQLAALTGPGSAWGSSEVDGVLLAVKEAKSKRLEFGLEIIVEDTQTDFVKTVNAYRKLVDLDGVKVVIGPTWNEFTQVMLQPAKDDGVMLLTPSASFDKFAVSSPYFFSTSHSVRFRTIPIARHMRENGRGRIAIAHDQNAFVELVYGFFLEEAAKNNLTIMEDTPTDPGNKDYRTELLRLINSRADAIYAMLAFPENIGVFIKQARELGYEGPIYTTENVELESLVANYGRALEGVIYSYPDIGPEEEAFLKRYEAEYGRQPAAPSAMSAYDAANLLIMALKSGARTPGEIALFLREVKDYRGASNIISFDEFGQIANKDYRIKTIQNGTFVFA
jgi:branched-chain amino acid transport system substrate-binding protein